MCIKITKTSKAFIMFRYCYVHTIAALSRLKGVPDYADRLLCQPKSAWLDITVRSFEQ